MNTSPPPDTEVLIVGGGLAGLTLAIQLKQQDPAIGVVVLERHVHPVPEAAFKVGESSVEIGAHYFAEVLGLREHLEQQQIRKFGFRFYFSDRRGDLDRSTEIGIVNALPTPSWQLDRGRFENFLTTHARSLGVDIREGARVRAIEMADADASPWHRVRYQQDDTGTTLHARWIVDASGRSGLLKRKLGLAERNDHDANAVWWRIDGRVDPNAWSNDAEWLQRCQPAERWRATNHLCGRGYWVWLIPLASGAHSLGIVCDSATHPLATMDTHDKAMAWLQRHQPVLAAQLQSDGHALRDFRFLRDFSYGCKQVFSADRWALTGEAGLFLDPLYSPGSDFIAIGNTFICDLIRKDLAGRSFAAFTEIYQQLYFSFYRSTLTLYQDQYPVLADDQVMPLKVIWDYTFYWSFLAPLFCAGRLVDMAILGQLRRCSERMTLLNEAMQPMLREWAARNTEVGRTGTAARSLDQYLIPWFHELNRALHDRDDDQAFVARISANTALMGRLADELLVHARREHAGIDGHGLDALLADAMTAAERGGEPLLSAVWYDQPAPATAPVAETIAEPTQV